MAEVEAQADVAAEAPSLHGGGGETFVSLSVPLGGECSDGAAEEQRQQEQAWLSVEEPLTSGNQLLKPTSTLSSLKH